MRKIFVITWASILIFSLLAGCIVEEPQTDTITIDATPTLVSFMRTQNKNALRPLLFREDDFDWGIGVYGELTDHLAVDWGFVEEYVDEEFVAADLIADDTMGAFINLNPSREMVKGGYTEWSPIGASQVVHYYEDESIAQQVGRLEQSRSEQIGTGGIEHITPRLNSVAESCWRARDSRIGEYQNCAFFGQYGNYVTFAGMVVDEENFTMEHWLEFTNLIQDKIVAVVDSEQ
ncbi:MAG: hypothetical protein IAF02_05080 [Anaerolineae bacterium]|nr:hypothetical protein [Anaerolineae bacterium]